MTLVRPALILVVVVALAGCGSSHARRNAVNAYFAQVDRAEQPLLAATGQIDKALRSFSPGSTAPAERHQLAWAESKIGRALARVRRIQPPPDAKKVHADLVRVLALQALTAHELAWTARYQALYGQALSPLPAASRRLARDIAGVGKASAHPAAAVALNAYGAAFSRYGQTLSDVLARLERLDPPPEVRAGSLSERARLRASVALCRSIAQSLAHQDVKGADASIKQLFTIGAAGIDAQVRKAGAAAVHDYNARLERIAALSTQVQADRQALVKEVG